MLSVIIPTRDCERALVPTLAMLVPGVMASIVREVIVADGGSTDGTRQVVDVAGCAIMASTAPVGARLREAAVAARADWLMFLQPGTVLESGWVAELTQFGEAAAGDAAVEAAVFRPAAHSLRPRPMLMELAALVRNAIAVPSAAHGLVIAKALYQRLGGHSDDSDAERALIRRIGRKRLVRLRSGIRQTLDGGKSVRSP
jgi:glycosyltransferase involved in cell wall biosynthesis